ncbi:hypothetical protein AKO1_006927 [Acrasis kona]|uniref:Conserved oligomeric Golgi complex subunit 8 n=1 Tax=Acrasis kona TaxID=1008807 RepID=A0AAW2YUI7_9EUKA
MATLNYNELTGQSVSELQYEHSHKIPSNITNLHRQIEKQAVSEYPVLLETQNTLLSLSTNLNKLQSLLQKDTSNTSSTTVKNDGLVFDSLQEFKSSLDQFQNSDQLYQNKKQSNKLSLENFKQLASLLEIPQLTETCVRNDLYGEALELDDALRNMCRNNPDLEIVEKLKNETQQCVAWLTNKLISTLKSRTCNVPVCLKNVSYLRRMQVCHSEKELRILFLQCRSHHLQEKLMSQPLQPNIDQERIYDTLSHITDTLKTQMFEIIMQYQAVFPTSQSQQQQQQQIQTPVPATPSTPSMNESAAIFGSEDVDVILSSCTVHMVQLYLPVLQYHLQRYGKGTLTGESCAKLLEQIMYCGHRLARLGADFRPIVAQMFVERVIRVFEEGCKDAVSRFSKSMSDYRWSQSLNKVTPSPSVPVNSFEEGINNTPPKVLLSHLPLAELLNDGLIMLNELRHCCPMECRAQLIQIFCDHLLVGVCETMVNVSQSYPFDDREKIVLKNLCKMVNVDLLRYLVGCFERIIKEPIMEDERVVNCLQTLTILGTQ